MLRIVVESEGFIGLMARESRLSLLVLARLDTPEGPSLQPRINKSPPQAQHCDFQTHLNLLPPCSVAHLPFSPREDQNARVKRQRCCCRQAGGTGRRKGKIYTLYTPNPLILPTNQKSSRTNTNTPRSRWCKPSSRASPYSCSRSSW